MNPIQTSETKPSRSLAEWVTFSIALIVLAIVAGLVVYSWLTRRDQPPTFTLNQNQEIQQVEGKFYVPFEIVNIGGETAESVQVVAELQIDGKVAESGDITIDFLSQDEQESGTFVFSQDPRKGQLALRVSGYTVP